MREPWTQRTFAFDFPVARAPVFLSRLRATPGRITTAVRGLSPAALIERPDGRWSIQEHVGHLFELDSLHLRRIDELAGGAEALSAADMDNAATWAARFNDRAFAEVLAMMAQRRQQLLASLGALDAEALGRVGLHPRLQTPMRAVDVASFAADHDDHHLVEIEALSATSERPPARAVARRWRDLPHDAPMPLLERHRIVGFDAMISHITLHKGCKVPVHAHSNEQFACVLSGKVRFTLADDEQQVLSAGDVLHLPGCAPHGAEALETSVVLDIFSPPSESTGIDEK